MKIMLNNIWAITLVTFKESFRNKLFYSILALAILLAFLNIYVGNLFSWDLGKVSVEFGLSVTSITGLLLLFYQGMKVFVDDLEKHTIFLTMSKPVAYWQYVLGKFGGLALILLVIVLFYSISSTFSLIYFLQFYPAYIPINFSWPTFYLAYIFNWLALMVVLALSLFWFAFARQPLVAIILTVMCYLVGNNLHLIRQYIINSGPDTPSIQLNTLKAITWIFPNLNFFNLKFEAAYGLEYSVIQLIYTVLYAISMMGILLFLATFFFRRKEMI